MLIASSNRSSPRLVRSPTLPRSTTWPPVLSISKVFLNYNYPKFESKYVEPCFVFKNRKKLNSSGFSMTRVMLLNFILSTPRPDSYRLRLLTQPPIVSLWWNDQMGTGPVLLAVNIYEIIFVFIWKISMIVDSIYFRPCLPRKQNGPGLIQKPIKKLRSIDIL